MSDQESPESGQVERDDLERQTDQPDVQSTEPSGEPAPGWVSGSDVVTPERQAETPDSDYNEQADGESVKSAEEA